MENEKLVAAFEKNEKLARQIIKMWREEAKTEEIVELLTKDGIAATAEDVENLFAEMQNAEAKAIGLQRMDEDQLKAVAGGTDCGQSYCMEHVPDGAHLGKCSQDYLDRECAATVENGSWCWSNDSCYSYSEIYYCITPSHAP